ncbi:MAG: ABC transporter ATP-binding protein, partial [Deltaproteobacteria bacterium]|nr:ABC transporter ATP-binding protein [Deltaproteobacteria bacterium]
MALLKVEQLSIVFPDSRKGGGQPSVAAVSDLTFKVRHGQTLCLVGESGSGKSLTARAVMGLLPQAAHMTGQILFDSVPLFENGIAHQGHRYCGNGMAMVFQEPLASLTPSMTVENLVGEAWRYRTHSTREVTRRRVVETLAQVGVPEPEALLSRYPWQLSGGLAQRVLIASALI